jgi:putative FmdB family regulatory protein
MPVYTYRCWHCGIEFEKKQAFLDKPLARCPDCNQCALRRVPQLPAVIFNGSGWYSTDHRSAYNQKAGTVNKKRDEAERSSGEKSAA